MKPGAKPFLRIYLYRDMGEELGAERERLFGEIHRELGAGIALEKEAG